MARIDGIKKLTPKQYFDIPNGTEIFNHGAKQCVAAVNLYLEGVLEVPLPQSDERNEFHARYLWTRYPSDKNMQKHFKRSKTPVRGAIAVWGATAANGFSGHTGMVSSVADDGQSFVTREQNYGKPGTPEGNLWKYRRQLDDPNLLGFLIPRKNPAVSSPIAKIVNAVKRTLLKRTLATRLAVRATPSTSAKVIATIRPSTLKTLHGWKRGSRVGGSTTWFRVKTSKGWGWASAAGFKPVSPGGMKRLKEYR